MSIKKPLGIGLLLGLLALAFAALPAMASAQTFENELGSPLGTGAALTGFSNNLVFTNSNGAELKCTENTLNGTVTNNPPGEAEITSATFTGTGGGACATNVPGVTAEVTAAPSPWTLALESAGMVFHLREHIVFTATLKAGGSSIAHCTYTRLTSVTGTFTTGPSAILTIAGEPEFIAVPVGEEAEPQPLCGTGGKLTSGEFSLSSEGEAVGIS